MLDIEIVTRPGIQDWRAIVDRDEFKLHIRMLSDSLDPELEQALKSAIDYCSILNRSLLPTEYKRYLTEFPSTGIIRLPYPPLRQVQSLKYLDGNSATQTLSSTKYIIRNDGSGPAEIEFIDKDSLPDTATHPRALTVSFTAGYGSEAGQVPVPHNLKRLVKLLSAHFIENPEATINDARHNAFSRKIEFGADELIKSLRIMPEYGDWV